MQITDVNYWCNKYKWMSHHTGDKIASFISSFLVITSITSSICAIIALSYAFAVHTLITLKVLGISIPILIILYVLKVIYNIYKDIKYDINEARVAYIKGENK